ncbi:phage tail tape measure protein [Deinococcus enclensis]|uniref:TP901 family phage tail tape measure protein n=1 Tax=Deinococcus enclensis TaxID=1049582 RepID=A0ABT9MB71_9DEIO|nr:phage tail tape measure protein [Deinococcus enclensis]MDP9763837.1 TP901 family phage tail tape measure protein [Deinococcus enclensis]
MTKDPKRTVTYTLQSRATGIAGLERFYKSLEQILSVQDKIKAQGDVVAGLRAQAQESITVAQREAQAVRESVRVKQQATNEYAGYRRRQLTEEQIAINNTIRALGNQQRSMRDLWQAGKTTGADIVTQQREIQKAALEAAGALKRESDEYRKLTSIAASAERTINSATGKLTPGGFAHGVVQGIQGSGLFTQLAAMGGLGSTVQNLGIVAGGFTTAKKAALDFGNASNTAATASGFLAGGLNALGLALVAAGAGLVALGRTGMQELATLERGLNTLQANGVQNLAEVRSNVRALKDELGNVGKTLSEADLTAASGELVKANLSVADSLKVLAPAARLAAAENTNLVQTSTQLLMNTRQYNLDVSQSGRVADMFAKAGNLAAGTANDLSLGFGKVGGTGLQAKIAMNDLLGMLVELDLKGMSAADVGADALRTALSSLADPSKKAQGIFKELNIELEDSQGKARPAGDILADLGQKMRGMGITVNKATGELQGNGEALRTVAGLMDTRAAAAIINLTGDWREHGKAIQDSEGYATEYADTMSQGATQAMARFQTSLKDAGLALVENFAEPLSDLLDNVITPGAEKIGEWLRGLKGLSDMGEVSLALKIKTSDDASERFMKLLASGVVGAGEIIVRIVEGASANAAAADKQANDLVQAYELSKLQVELVKYGILPREMNPFKQLEQARMIAANEASFRAQLVTAMNQAVAAITGKAPTMQPLKGQGPLAPGQSRDLGVGLGSADTITRMDPAFQQQIGKALMQYVAQNAGGLIPYIHEGYRSQERQAQLYAQGRTAPGPVVTNAKPGQSIHNYGMAADIYWKDPKTGKVLSFNDPRALAAARSLGQIAVGQGLVWGGTPGWGGPVDLPHIQANLSWQEAARRAGGAPVNTPASTKPFTPATDQAVIAEARRILGKIKEYEEDGKLTAATQARSVLKAFEDSGPRAAEAIRFVQRETKAATAEVSKFGQGFDALKVKLEQTESLYKINDDTKGYIKSLDEIAAAALKAYEAEKARNGLTPKAQALYGLAGDATAKARQQREAIAREQKQDQDQAERDRKKAEEDRKRAEQEAARLAANRLAAERALQEGQRDLAKKTAQGVITDYQNQLKAAGDNAQARLAVEQRLAQDVLKARNVLDTVAAQEEKARLERERNAAMNADGVTKDQRVRLWGQYAERIAQVDRDLQVTLQENARETGRVVDAAQDTVWKEEDAERARAYAERVKGYLSDLETMTEDGLITVYNEARAHRDQELLQQVYDEWERRRKEALSAAEEEARVVGEIQEEAIARVTQEGLDLADSLEQVGDTQGAIDALQATLGDLYARAADGENAVDGINRVTDALNALSEALRLDTAMFDLTLDLTGTIDEQIAQMVEKIASIPESDPALRKKAEAHLATLRSQLPEYVDPSKSGYAPGSNGQGFAATQGNGSTELLDADSEVRQLLTDIELETDPARLQGLLSNLEAFMAEKSHLLSSWVVKNVEDAKSSAQEYIRIMQDIPDTPVGDAVSRTDGATDGATGGPANRYGELDAYLTSGQTDYSDPEAVKTLTDGLQQARAAGELTDAQLRDLLRTVQDLAAGPTIPEALDLTALEQAAVTAGNSVETLKQQLKDGTISAEDARKQMLELLPSLEKLATAAEKSGNTELAADLRKWAAALRALGGDALKAAEALTKLQEAATEVEKWGGLLKTVGKLFGQGEDSDFGILLGGAVNSATLGLKAFGQFMTGDFVGMAQTAVEWVMNLGSTIENLSPGLKAWKKGLLEVAAAQREAMGSAKINTWLNNPYHNELAADAAAREKLGNSSWLDRLGWDLFGGRPQHMDDATAKMKIEAAKAFASLGQDLATSLEDELMKGFESGSFDGVNASVDRKLDLFVAQTALRMLFAKSKLEDLLKAFAEESARGGDTSDELAAIRTERDRITQEWASLAPSLPGYGSGSDGSAPGSSPAGDPVVGANFYVANSSKIDLFDHVIQRADAMYLRHEGVLTRHGDVLARHADVLERVMRDGIRLTDAQGNMRGEFRT